MKIVAFLIATSLLSVSAQAASLPGTIVTGSILAGPDANITTQFRSAIIVGSTHFTGAIHENAFDEDFGLTADFSADSLILHITSIAPFANVDTTPFLTLNFGSPTGLFPAIISSVHSCDADAASSDCLGHLSYIPSFTSSASNIQIIFTQFDASDIYTLTFAPAAAAVPEPAIWSTMILGLGMVGYAMRRRQKITTRISYAG